MRTTKNLLAAIAGGVGGLALVALAPTPASGQPAQECNGFIDLAYVNPMITMVGDTVRVKITIGAGEIIAPAPNPIQPPRISFGPTLNGTQLDAIHFFLDCQFNIGMITPDACQDDGAVVTYPGDANANIVTTCHEDATNPASPLVTWKSTALTSNVLAFNPVNLAPFGVVSLVAPAVQGPCDLEFDVTVAGFPSKGLCSQSGFPPGVACNPQGPNTCPGAPGEVCFGLIPEIAEYPDAICSNGLDSGGFQTAAIGVAPTPASNFNCYQIPGHEAGKPPQCPNCTPTLIDTFTAPAGVTLAVGTPHRLCAPAALTSVPDQPMPDPKGVHLEGYDYGKIPPSFPNIKGVTVTDVFGTITGDVKGTPNRLLVPTGKCSPPGMGCTPQVPPPPSIHHFQCYPFINVTGSGKSATGVTTTDQFANLGPFKILGQAGALRVGEQSDAGVGTERRRPRRRNRPDFPVVLPRQPEVRRGSGCSRESVRYADYDSR